MAARRPFAGESELFEVADKTWSALAREDWLEAFLHNPPIGEKRANAKQSATASRWSAKEQSSAQKAAPEVLEALTAFLKANRLKTDWQGVESAPNEALVNALAMVSPYGTAEKQALLEAPCHSPRPAYPIQAFPCR